MKKKKANVQQRISFLLSSTAIKILVIPEVAVVKHAVMFLQHFILQSRLNQRTMDVILGRGEQMLHTTLMSIGVFAPRAHLDVYSDIIIMLNKKFPTEFATWIKMLEVDNFPTPAIAIADKQQFMRAILR